MYDSTDSIVSGLYPDAVVQEALRVVTVTRFNKIVLDTVRVLGGFGCPGTLEVVRWIRR